MKNITAKLTELIELLQHKKFIHEAVLLKIALKENEDKDGEGTGMWCDECNVYHNPG